MKTIKQIREYLAERPDDEIIFCALYDKSEIDEHVEENMEMKPLSNEEWSEIVDSLNVDDGLWQEIIESKNWYLEKILDRRSKGNDDSE